MSNIIIATTQMLSTISTTVTTVTNITSIIIINTLTFTATNIYTLGKNIFIETNSLGINELYKIENELDLIETIKIYESWIIEMSEKKNNEINNSNTIIYTIMSFNNILQELHVLLQNIELKIEYHKTKWFNNYRSIDLSYEITELKIKKNKLDNRFNLLQQVINSKI